MTDHLEMKSFGSFEVKDETTGEVTAIIATLNTVDRDGDVILPGAIPSGTRVKLSGYGHDAILKGAPPAGIGTVTEENGRVILRGRFFLSTPRGNEAFMTVRELGAEGEWSVGFPTASARTSPMTDDWRTKGARRLIKGMSLIEASPVFIGAQLGTGTLLTKEAPEESPPDPAIEAARLATEQAARELAEKAQAIARSNEAGARRFSQPPIGIKAAVR